MSSSLPSCCTELMLNTILLWFWPSEDVPKRLHLCFPALLRSQSTSSPLMRDTDTPTPELKSPSPTHTDETWVPKTAGHQLGRSSFGPVGVKPEPLFDARLAAGASLLQMRQLECHHPCRGMERQRGSAHRVLGGKLMPLRANRPNQVEPFPLAVLQSLTVWSLLPDAR